MLKQAVEFVGAATIIIIAVVSVIPIFTSRFRPPRECRLSEVKEVCFFGKKQQKPFIQ